MKSFRSVNSVLLLFWLDVFVLSLVSVASFFFIGENFSNISFLGLALSLRTLSSAISSYFIGPLTAKINAKKILMYTQGSFNSNYCDIAFWVYMQKQGPHFMMIMFWRPGITNDWFANFHPSVLFSSIWYILFLHSLFLFYLKMVIYILWF